MGFEVQTDHQVVPFGENTMKLFDRAANEVGFASRVADNTPWLVHINDDLIEGAVQVDDVQVETRNEAINALIEKTLEALPGTGYSTIVPHGLSEMP